MNAPTATVLRGQSAINEVRDLLDQLAHIDSLTDRCSSSHEEFDPSGEGLAMVIEITPDEVHDVIARRRTLVTNKLENKGIRIAPDPGVLVASEEQ